MKYLPLILILTILSCKKDKDEPAPSCAKQEAVANLKTTPTNPEQYHAINFDTLVTKAGVKHAINEPVKDTIDIRSKLSAIGSFTYNYSGYPIVTYNGNAMDYGLFKYKHHTTSDTRYEKIYFQCQ